MVRTLDPEKKAAFLRAALELFVAQGVPQTTTAQIAGRAGTAAGTLFLYFPTKQGLIEELLLSIGKQQSDYIYSLLQPDQPVRDTFFTIWQGSVNWLLEHMDAFQYVQQVRDSRMLSDAVLQESAKFFAYYYQAIQRGMEEQILKPYPPDMIGGFLYQDIVAVVISAAAQPDPQARERIVRMGFDIFWDGIKRWE